VRFVLYFLLLIALQGGLSALIPQNLGGPNLFLLTAVALALRLHPVPSLLVAYTIGLVQDVLGHGYFGLHAAGLAGGVLLLHGLRGLLMSTPALREGVGLGMALIGQWLTFLVLTYWLRDGLVTVSSLTGVLPLEAVLTFLAYPIMRPLLNWTFGPLKDSSEVIF
jgi:rod shape-determining protein MreD